MRREYVGIAFLEFNGKMVTHPKEKADVLNKQFVAVFVKERPIEPALQKCQPFLTWMI